MAGDKINPDTVSAARSEKMVPTAPIIGPPAIWPILHPLTKALIAVGLTEAAGRILHSVPSMMHQAAFDSWDAIGETARWTADLESAVVRPDEIESLESIWPAITDIVGSFLPT